MRLLDLFRRDKDAIYDKGVDALKRGDVSAAIQHFSTVVKLDPSDAPAHYNLAVSYVGAKQYAAGVRHFREYMRLESSMVDENLPEYVEVLNRAASGDIIKAEQILRDYVRKQEQASSQATVAGTTIRVDDLLRAADELLFTKGFSEGPTVQKFGKAMSAKIPLRFYGVKGLQDIDPQDAFGFAIALTATGYAVARASKSLLGHSAYVAALPAEVVRKLRSGQHEEGIPIGYNIDVLQAGNPIPWNIINRVLQSCIDSNLINLLNRLPRARKSAEAIKEHLVKEFVLVGYYIGLWENAGERNG